MRYAMRIRMEKKILDKDSRERTRTIYRGKKKKEETERNMGRTSGVNLMVAWLNYRTQY